LLWHSDDGRRIAAGYQLAAEGASEVVPHLGRFVYNHEVRVGGPRGIRQGVHGPAACSDESWGHSELSGPLFSFSLELSCEVI
jgi:hypothetical protein